jgi:hypothetical protein
VIDIRAACISPRTCQPTSASPPMWGRFHDPEPDPNQRDPPEAVGVSVHSGAPERNSVRGIAGEEETSSHILSV